MEKEIDVKETNVKSFSGYGTKSYTRFRFLHAKKDELCKNDCVSISVKTKIPKGLKDSYINDGYSVSYQNGIYYGYKKLSIKISTLTEGLRRLGLITDNYKK